MYDISGAHPGVIVERVTSHWAAMETSVVSSSRYLHHRGRPLVALWGFGFLGGSGTALGQPEQANQLLDFFERAGATVMGGVPTYWREGTNDSAPGPAWAAVYRRFGIISPWTVGRYTDPAGAAEYAQLVLSADIAEAKRVGADLVPVVYPGYSERNVLRIEQPTAPLRPLNEIPRQGGTFWWAQAKTFREAGAQMFYGAMFDEVDESTAMFKIARATPQLPVGPLLVAADVDGYPLPSDWYLRLAGAAAQRLHSGADFEAAPPIAPPGVQWPTTVPTPIIASVSPAAVSAGQVLTVSGVGFGASQGGGYVSFGDQGTAWGSPRCAATFDIDSWSDSEVTFTVPSPSGPDGVWHVVPASQATITVTNAASQVSNVATVTIAPG
jgi:hypothetical protein